MKHVILILLSLMVAVTMQAQSKKQVRKDQKILRKEQESIQQIRDLDDSISSPFVSSLVSGRAYRKLLYKDQQSIGGSAIKEGRAVGTSATVEANSVTANVGSPVLAKYLTVQATLKGSSEDGFVNVFSGKDYQKTLGAGGTVLFFLPWTWSTKAVYKEETRIRLHQSLRQARYKNEGINLLRDTIPGSKGTWDSAYIPTASAKYLNNKLLQLQKFVTRRNAFFKQLGSAAAIQSFYANTLLDSEEKRVRASYHEYLKAEEPVLDVLTDEWYEVDIPLIKEEAILQNRLAIMPDPSNTSPVVQYILLVDSASSVRRRTHLIHYLRLENEKKRQNALAVYDTLQLKASWVWRHRAWLSFTGLYNNATQPKFDPSLRADVYKKTGRDEYFEGRAAYNDLLIYSWGKMYGSAALGVDNKRVFDKGKLRTYQISTPEYVGSDTVQVIKQSQAYPEFPLKRTFTTIQLQYSVYWTKKVGLDVTWQGHHAGQYRDWHEASFGIFVPISSGESTLLFMPQAKWTSYPGKEDWTFGFNLSASIPGFVTK